MSDDFDLDAWVNGANRVTKSVTVYAKPGHQGLIDAKTAELRRAQSVGAVRDDRLNSDGSPLRILAEEIESLRTEMAASELTFTFTALNDDDLEAVQAEAKTAGASDVDRSCRILARQCTSPAGVTWQHLRTLHRTWGEGYFVQTLLATANACTQGTGVDVPFSHAAWEAAQSNS